MQKSYFFIAQASLLVLVVATSALGKSTKVSPLVTSMPSIKLENANRYELVAAPAHQTIAGKTIQRLAYNGSIPGPILRVKQGSQIQLKLQNNTGIDTTLHPHGLRVDDKNDGIPGLSQPPIKPGSSFTYTLKFLDAGIYWYHPHIREDYAQDAGLYGVFLVEPQDPQYYNPVDRELVLILDDMPLKNPTSAEKPISHTLMGRFGDQMLVNGQTDFSETITQGDTLRIFLLNAANTRTFAWHIPGMKMKLVGSDNGLYERETWVDAVTLSPSERAIVELRFAKAGEFTMANAKPGGDVTLGKLSVLAAKKAYASRVSESDFQRLRTKTPQADSFTAVRKKLSAPVDEEVTLTLSMDHSQLPMDGMHMSHKPDQNKDKGIEWEDEMAAMNTKSNQQNVRWKIIDKKTKHENMAINWQFKLNTLVKIRIVNASDSMHPMQHPIHFHGQRFVVAAIDGKQNDNLVWKDSVLVTRGATVDIILEASNPGNWMGHCHIAEHTENGMMLGFSVVPR